MPGTEMHRGFQADYFDGRISRRHEVTVIADAGRVKVVGRDVDLQLPREQVDVQPRLGTTPLRIALPEGGLLVSTDAEGVQATLGIPPGRTLAHRLESHLGVVFLSLVGIGIAGFFAYRDGIPWAAERIAHHVPPKLEASMADEGLRQLDRFMLHPSKREPERRAQMTDLFAHLRTAAGLEGATHLEMRDSAIFGPNAFALPGGTIVVTDQIDAVLDDRELAAVLAHELGHVKNRHVLRHVLGNSLHALIVLAIYGDASAIAGIAATLPTVLLNTTYSRDFEREADAYAFDLLRKSGASPRDFADALRSLEDAVAVANEQKGRKARSRGGSSYLSTHPSSEERIKAAEDAAR